MRTPAGIELPDQDNIEIALSIARSKLNKIDPPEAAGRLGCEFRQSGGGKFMTFSFMDAPISVALPQGESTFQDGRPLPDFLNVFVLHYLVSPGILGPEGDTISFVQVPSGSFYEQAFNRNTRAKLVRAFGPKPKLFSEVAEKLGWKPGRTGDASAVALPFPKVPVTFVIWAGDDELPPDANVLFSDCVSDFLPTEDINIICSMLVGKVLKTKADLEGENG